MQGARTRGPELHLAWLLPQEAWLSLSSISQIKAYVLQRLPLETFRSPKPYQLLLTHQRDLHGCKPTGEIACAKVNSQQQQLRALPGY